MVDQSSKVVDLQSRREPTGAVVVLPEPLRTIRDKCALFLNDRVCNLLDDVDDALFELADEASNAREQHMYFDAMREIRLNRESIEKRFADAFSAGFQSGVATSLAVSTTECGRAKMKLLESEALEELVALEGLAKKGERRFLHEVWILCTAWQHSSNGPVVAAKDLPMGPSKIAAALGWACHGLDVDIKARLVLFKLFDSKIICSYNELYQTLIPVLEAQGLPLEQLNKTSANANASGGVLATAHANQTSSSSESASEAAQSVTRLFDAFENLLGNGVNSSGQRMAVSKPSFMVALQDMQDQLFSELNAPLAKNGELGIDFVVIAQKLVARLTQVNRVAMADASALSYQRDQDTINFVGALFQYILDGDSLAEPLKGLIARLQIPVLKMAMLDNSFFANEEHPARKLLSALVSAGIGWLPIAGVEKDPLYKKIEKVVMQVLRDFGVDTQVFVDAVIEFSVFHEKSVRRSELVAKRTVDSEGAKASAEMARNHIAAILDERLEDSDYPAVLVKILQQGWSKVLFLSDVQHGRDSARFNEDVALIDRLIWSVQPSADKNHRNELIASLPVLIEALRLGFNRVSLSSHETKQWFEELESLHMAKLSRKERVVIAEKAVPDDDFDLAALDASLDDHFDSDDILLLDSDAVHTEESVTASPEVANPSDISGSLPSVDEDKLAEIEAEFSAQIKSLRVGSWLDFRQEDGKMLRCRLAAVIKGIGKYIFVNRSGIKVAEFNHQELAQALSEKLVLLIDDDRMFDRALESVINNLRDMKDKPMS
jgi:hypothetical protein